MKVKMTSVEAGGLVRGTRKLGAGGLGGMRLSGTRLGRVR